MTAVQQRATAKPKPRRRASERSSGRRSTRSPEAPGEARDEARRLRIRRFDADRRDGVITLGQALGAAPNGRQLLWIDIVREPRPGEMESIAKRFELDAQTRRALEDPTGRPHLVVHGSYVHVSVAADPGAEERAPENWLHVVTGRNVVITRRAGTVLLLDEIDERLKADTTIGAIEGAEFLALLLDAILTSYLVAVDEIEDEIDRLDERSLRDDGRRKVLEDLVRWRRRIARLRRSLTAHRTLFAALAGPEMRQVVGSDAADGLQAVVTRFEAALTAVEGSRTALLGSFDVYMTRTAQRTNDVMKVLTIATVLLLPGSVIAGLLGMNVIVPLNKDDPMSFWLVIAGVAALAGIVLAVAHRRRWI